MSLAYATPSECKAMTDAITADCVRRLLGLGLPPWRVHHALEAAALIYTPLTRLAADDPRIVAFMDGARW